jgi:hypothetical protein
MPPKKKQKAAAKKSAASAKAAAAKTPSDGSATATEQEVSVSRRKAPPKPATTAQRKQPPPTASAVASQPGVSTTPNARSRPTAVATPPGTVPVAHVQVPLPGTGNNDVTNEELTQDRSSGNTYRDLVNQTDDNNAIRVNVRNFVTLDFFPHVKFITRKSKLAFFDAARNPNTYCAVVTKGCNLPAGIKPVVWWETIARQEVRRKITKLRSDKLTALKWVYIGKFGSNFCYVQFYPNTIVDCRLP